MAQKSYRIRFNFWLDISKPEEEAIADDIELLKNQRSFSQTIRNGIRLIVDLQSGNTDVLFELFPLMKAKLQASSSSNDDNSGNLSRDIARLESLILRQASNTDTAIMKPVSNGVKSIGGIKPLAAPVFDDDDDTMLLTVTKHEGAGEQAAQNFLNSIMGLQQ